MSYNPCTRGCCWTPMGVCAKKRAGIYHCDCHLSERARAHAEAEEKRDMDLARGDTHRVTGNTRKTRS